MVNWFLTKEWSQFKRVNKDFNKWSWNLTIHVEKQWTSVLTSYTNINLNWIVIYKNYNCKNPTEKQEETETWVSFFYNPQWVCQNYLRIPFIPLVKWWLLYSEYLQIWALTLKEDLTFYSASICQRQVNLIHLEVMQSI